MESNTLIPKLRFPEFRDAPGWGERLLTDVLKEHGCKSDGTSKVHSVSVHKGIVNQVEHLGRSFAAADTSHYNLVLPGDVVYTKSPTGDFPFGIVKQSKLGYPVIVSPLYGVFTPETRYLGTILDAYFESAIRTNNYLAPITQKGAKNTIQISNATFLSKGLPLPRDHAEQRKIAECLTSLDELIAAEGRKLEALRAHKKALMQNLFPREGETTPRLRFPEFHTAGEWEEGKLSAHVDLISGTHLLAGQYGQTGDIPYFTGPTDFTNNPEGISKWTTASGSTGRAHDTLITVKGSGVGQLWYLDLPLVALGRQLMAVRPRLICSQFIFQLLSMKRTRFEALASGNLIPGLSRGDILDLTALFPSPPEADRIASCLGSLDTLITKQTKKLDTLKTHKQGLMQGLFPSEGDDPHGLPQQEFEHGLEGR